MTTTTQAPPSFTLTVKDVAHASHVAPSAVRFYEEHGLIHARRPPGTSAGSTRTPPAASGSPDSLSESG